VHLLRAVRRTRPSGETYLDAFTLERDITALRDTVASLDDVRLVIIDPVSAYLGSVDSHKNAEVRSVLMPLAELASDLRVAIVCISHLNKGSSTPLYRAMGSVAFVAAARSVWIFAKSPDDPARRLMIPGKMNLAPDVEGMEYSLEDQAGVVTVRWGHAINVAADTVLGTETPDERSERAEAVQWLRERLSGGPVEVKKLEADARNAHLAWRTLRRAKDAIGAVSSKDAFSSGWLWHLPQHGHEGGQPPTPSSLATLGAFEDGQPTKVATKVSTEQDWTPSHKTKKEDEDTKVATGVVESGFIRDTEGPGVTCTACAGHYGTYGGWHSHKLRHRCFKPASSGVIQ
jgi:putative DNA primase/helicase